MAETPRKKKAGPRKPAADLRALLDQFDVHNSTVGVLHGDQRFTYVAGSDEEALNFANLVNQHAPPLTTPHSRSISYSDGSMGVAMQHTPPNANAQQSGQQQEVAMFYPQDVLGTGPQPMDVVDDAAVILHDVPDTPKNDETLSPTATDSLFLPNGHTAEQNGYPQAPNGDPYGMNGYSYAPNGVDQHSGCNHPNGYVPNGTIVTETGQPDWVPRKDAGSTFVGLNALGNDHDLASSYGPPAVRDGQERVDRTVIAVVAMLLLCAILAWIIVPSILISKRDGVEKNWKSDMCRVHSQTCEWRSTDLLGSPCLGESWGEKASGEGWLLTPNCRWVDPDAYSMEDGVYLALNSRRDSRGVPASHEPASLVEGRRTLGTQHGQDAGEAAGPKAGLRYTGCHTQYKVTMEVESPVDGSRTTVAHFCRDNEVTVRPIFNTDSDFCQAYREGVKCDAAAARAGDERCEAAELSRAGFDVACWVNPDDAGEVKLEGVRSVQKETWALASLVAVIALLACWGCTCKVFQGLRSR